MHAVLERLFDLPAAERTPDAAAELVAPQWERLVEQEPDLAELFAAVRRPSAAPSLVEPAGGRPADAGCPSRCHARVPMAASDDAARLAAFLRGASALLGGYFAVEDPRRLEPAERESLVSTLVDDELLIRGYIDRLDVSPAGDLRVVDYKTGGAPREAFEARALFQLKFYALVLWRTRGVVPRVLRLLYLKDAEICDYTPDAEELARFERTLLALWQAIERATRDRTSGRSRAGSAAGAATRRSARRSAALRRPIPSRATTSRRSNRRPFRRRLPAPGAAPGRGRAGRR